MNQTETNAKRVVLLDGGMGQELIRRSRSDPHPLWSAKVMLDEPELVAELHREFIEAGAKVITINAYSATPERLERHGLEDKFQFLQDKAVELARRARDGAASGDDVLVAGCLSPLFGTYHPEAAPEFEECLERYRDIVEAQTNGVDLFLCETMSSVKEARAAATAAVESGKKVWLSFTLDDSRPDRLRSGEIAVDAFRSVADTGVEAILVNCSTPETISASMNSLVSAFPVVGAYGNGFISVDALDVGGTVDVLRARKDLSPVHYADFALSWAEAGAKILGGCCEIGPAHVSALRDRLISCGYGISADF
jgi:S-methylmethionine-dependent homocysteine/selenocysteine methylase